MFGELGHTIVVLGLIVSCLSAVVAFLGFRSLSAHRWGRIALLVALSMLPLAFSAASVNHGVAESSRTRFCLQCHEMQDYGKSLFVDNRQSLPAVHYQNRLIDRDTTCYACHTDYAMFGTVKAKVNGLRHVWAHYVAGVPDKIQLYQPYKNASCLHCHEDARRFAEAAPHQGILPQLSRNEVSCLQCHRVAHDMAAVKAHQFWQAR